MPCVIYGGEKNIHFSAGMLELHKMVYTHDVYLLKIDLEGEVFDAVQQDIQFHPVTDEIIHVDFVQVFKDKPVTVSLPIELTGSSVGILSGGKLRQRRRHIKVQGLIEHMPDSFKVDMTDLDIGDFLKVGDLEGENLDILDPPKAMVAGVVSSRLVAKGLREIVEEEVAEEEVVEEGAEAPEGKAAPETGDESPSAEGSSREG